MEMKLPLKLKRYWTDDGTEQLWIVDTDEKPILFLPTGESMDGTVEVADTALTLIRAANRSVHPTGQDVEREKGLLKAVMSLVNAANRTQQKEDTVPNPASSAYHDHVENLAASGNSTLDGFLPALRGAGFPDVVVREVEALLEVLRAEGWSGFVAADKAARVLRAAAADRRRTAQQTEKDDAVSENVRPIAKPVHVYSLSGRIKQGHVRLDQTVLADANGETLLVTSLEDSERVRRIAAELNSTCQGLADELSLKAARLDVAWKHLDERGRQMVLAVRGTFSESGVSYPIMEPDSIRVERSTAHYHTRHDIEHEHDGGHEPHHHEEDAL